MKSARPNSNASSDGEPTTLQNYSGLSISLRVQLLPVLSNPMNYNPPGSSVHGIFQARILDWKPFPPPEDFTHPGIFPTSFVPSVLAGGFFTTLAYLSHISENKKIEKSRALTQT